MSADILVIGGGIAGISAAAELARDASVVVLSDEDSRTGVVARWFETCRELRSLAPVPIRVKINSRSKSPLPEYSIWVLETLGRAPFHDRGDSPAG